MKPVSIKKCLMGLTEKFKDEIETQTSAIYEKTIIKKLPTYLKKIVQTYPAKKDEIMQQLIQNFPHKDRPSVVTLLVYQRFSLKLAALLDDKGQLTIQEKVYRVIIESMANLDVEIKIRMRKGTHLVKTSSSQTDKKVQMNNIFQKIQSRETYGQKIMLRSQDEKEIKVELMMTSFLSFLNDKITQTNKEG